MVENHWEAVQAKTFTKWYNDKLTKGGFNPIQDIYKDLQDGVALGNLLKCLLNTNISYNKKPFTRIQKVENLEILLKFIKKQGLSLINIGPEDIVDCNKKLILGLIWTLISKLSISDLATGDLSVKEELLRWCKEATKDYKNVNINDLSRSWQDGLGFNALIHRFRPDLIPNFYELRSDDRHSNLEQAFDTAERKLQIPKLLDVEDVADVIRPDEKSMITYLSEYYKKFNQFEKDQICKNVLNSLLNKIEWSLQSRNFYEIKARSYLNNQKIYLEKKKEMDQMINKLNVMSIELENMNSRLSTDYLSINSTFAEINLLHDYYNIKEYKPPADISLDKINYHYDDISKYLFDNLNISIYKEDINDTISYIKESIIQDNQLNKRIILADELVKSPVNYKNPILDKDYKNIKDVIIQYTEFLNFLSNENLVRENTLKRALNIFDKYGKEITIKDFKNIIFKLGIFIDDEIIEKVDLKSSLNREDFIDTIKVLLLRSYDAVIIKKALTNLNEEVEISEKEHKNLLCFNGKDKNINVSKLVDEFLN